MAIPKEQTINARADEASVGRAIGVKAGGSAAGSIDELDWCPRCIDRAFQQRGQQQIAAALARLGKETGPAHRVEDPHAGKVPELTIDAEVPEQIHMGVGLAALDQDEQLPQPSKLQRMNAAAEIGQLQAGALCQQADMGTERELKGT